MPTPLSTAERLSKQFLDTFGSGLRSVVLFGSVARGEAIPGMSDVNVLVLLEEVSNRDLLMAAPMTQEWVRAGNTPPWLFSSEEWAGMGDTFAIEIADMRDARQVILGVDPVPEASQSASDLRLHAEHEIRDTLRHMRLRMLLAADNRRELGNLLVSGIPSFTAYMRAALRLSGQEAPMESPAVIELTATLLGTDPSPMIRCLRERQRREAPRVLITDPLVEGYMDFTQKLVGFIDGLPH